MEGKKALLVSMWFLLHPTLNHIFYLIRFYFFLFLLYLIVEVPSYTFPVFF